jgi:hypothetical protein
MSSAMKAAAITAILALGACGQADAETFTLYRNSVTDPNMRLHVATFDAREDGRYNRENCEITQDLFAGQPHVTVRYWCEKGRYRA